MRVFGLLLVLAAATAAGKNDVERWVRLLGHEDATVRTFALRKLAEQGEGVLAELAKRKGLDPEVARGIRRLTKRYATLRLLLTGPSGPQRIGSPLVLDVRLVNETDETFMLPVFAHVPLRGARAGGQRGQDATSAFLLRVGKDKPRWLRGHHVRLVPRAARAGGWGLALEPGGQLRVQLRLKDVMRRPGELTLSVLFNGHGVTKALLGSGNRVTILDRMDNLLLESRRIKVKAVGTTIAQLDADLSSGNRATVVAAIRELELRDDDAVLDLLRKHIRHPDLRVRAVERIGQKARDEDLNFLRRVAADENERRDVRHAAIEGLGRYKGSRRARSRLFSLAQDPRVRDAAVKALANHKGAATIDLFVRLLQRNFREGDWSQHARGALLEWTGIHVENRRSEIAAFERWWRANRARWISENDR